MRVERVCGAALRHLPPDVVDSNVLQKLSPADLRSFHKSSPAAAELVRRCKSTLALSRQALSVLDGRWCQLVEAGGAAIISTGAVAKVLAAYAAVSTLELNVKSADEALELVVILSCTIKLCAARPLRCALLLHEQPRKGGRPACLLACVPKRSR